MLRWMRRVGEQEGEKDNYRWRSTEQVVEDGHVQAGGACLVTSAATATEQRKRDIHAASERSITSKQLEKATVRETGLSLQQCRPSPMSHARLALV